MNHNMNYRRELKDKTFLLNRYKRNTTIFLFVICGKKRIKKDSHF